MSKQATSGGVGFLGLLALLFIALKLTGVINWSWLWVLSPLWIPVVVSVVLFGIFVVILLVVFLVSAIAANSR